MLLPSAFPYEGPNPRSATFSHRMRTPSVTSPRASSRHHQHQRASSTISSDIYSTCLALQTRITTNTPQSPLPQNLPAAPAPLLQPSPTFRINPSGAKPSSTAKRYTSKPSLPQQSQTQHLAPLSSTRKRRRSSISDDHRETCDRDDDGGEKKPRCSAPSTPKRPRLAPPSLPLGLSRADFDSPPLRTAPPPKSASVPSSLALDLFSSPRPSSSSTPTIAEGKKTEMIPRSRILTPATYSSSLVALLLKQLSLREHPWPRLRENRMQMLGERTMAGFSG
ncbi:MAG: hypothetical protein Q9191_007376 [Dirinaria sp. TL-2023a]